MSIYRRLSVGVTDIEQALSLWVGQLGFTVRLRETGADRGLEDLWDMPPGTIAEQALLETPGAPGGHLHLVRFHGETDAVRDGAAVTDLCPKNLDVNVVDLPAQVAVLRTAGYAPRSEPVAYNLDGMAVREVQFPLADGINLVLAEIVGEPLITTVRGYGGVTSVVTTTDDLEAETEFFVQLGFDQLEAHVLDGEVIERMVGLAPGGQLRLQLLGDPAHRFGRAELLRYTGTTGTDLYTRSRPPVRGLFRGEVEVPDLEATLARLSRDGHRVGRVHATASRVVPSPAASVCSPAGWWLDLVAAR